MTDFYIFDRVLSSNQIENLDMDYLGEKGTGEKVDVWIKKEEDSKFTKFLEDEPSTLNFATEAVKELYLGGDGYKDNYFAGKIDNIYIFDRILSVPQIQNLDQNYRDSLVTKWLPLSKDSQRPLSELFNSKPFA